MFIWFCDIIIKWQRSLIFIISELDFIFLIYTLCQMQKSGLEVMICVHPCIC